MRYEEWTPERLKILQEIHNMFSNKEVALLLGMTHDSYNALATRKLSPKKTPAWQVGDDVKVVSLHRSGVPPRKIAEQYEKPVHIVYDFLGRLKQTGRYYTICNQLRTEDGLSS